jgi:hypothetical protein
MINRDFGATHGTDISFMRTQYQGEPLGRLLRSALVALGSSLWAQRVIVPHLLLASIWERLALRPDAAV